MPNYQHLWCYIYRSSQKFWNLVTVYCHILLSSICKFYMNVYVFRITYMLVQLLWVIFCCISHNTGSSYIKTHTFSKTNLTEHHLNTAAYSLLNVLQNMVKIKLKTLECDWRKMNNYQNESVIFLIRSR